MSNCSRLRLPSSQPRGVNPAKYPSAKRHNTGISCRSHDHSFTSRAERERLNYLESIKHNALKHSHLPLTPPPYDASGHAMKGAEAFPVTLPFSKSYAPIAGIEHQPQRRRNDVNPSIYPDNAAQPPSWPLFFRILIWFCKLINFSNLVRNIIATFAILFVATCQA